MVGFLVGVMIGVLLGAFIICCLVVGDDEIDSYHKIIETYDKEVNRQYKVIKRVSKYIKDNFSNPDGTIWHDHMEKIMRMLEDKND